MKGSTPLYHARVRKSRGSLHDHRPPLRGRQLTIDQGLNGIAAHELRVESRETGEFRRIRSARPCPRGLLLPHEQNAVCFVGLRLTVRQLRHTVREADARERQHSEYDRQDESDANEDPKAPDDTQIEL